MYHKIDYKKDSTHIKNDHEEDFDFLQSDSEENSTHIDSNPEEDFDFIDFLYKLCPPICVGNTSLKPRFFITPGYCKI